MAEAQNSSLAYLTQRIDGQVFAEPGSFDSTDTLANYLRRGPSPLFQPPSTPAFYIKAASEEDTVQGVQFALDNGYKLSFRGGGACHRADRASLVAGT